MAYLHCHNCDWSQDDFYDDGYNPAKYLMSWNTFIFGEKRNRLDEQFTSDPWFIKENGDITTREVIAREYESFAKRIRTMKWISYDDYKNDVELGIAECPKCGSKNHFDID